MEISGLVITFNEEKNIGKCIDALLKVCDEVIVVAVLIALEVIESKRYQSNSYENNKVS